MKKSLSIILALLLLTATACQSGNNAKTETDTSSAEVTTAPETNHFDELVTDKYSGRTLSIFDINDHPTMHVNFSTEEQNGEIVNDALYDRDRLIEEKFGVEITYEVTPEVGAKDGTQTLIRSVLANEKSYDYVIGVLLGGALMSASQQGVLTNLCDVPHLSLTENWWSKAMYDNFRLNDTMYYSTGDIAASMYQMVWVTFANTRLMDDYQITDDLFSLVFDGKWTLDKLYDLTKDMNRDLNDDGKLDTSDDFIAAFDCYKPESCGVHLVSVSDDNTALNIDIHNERLITYVDKCSKLFAQITSTGNANESKKAMFKEGRCLFYSHPIEVAMSHFRDMEDDYLVLPMAKLDEKQEEYYGPGHGWVSAFMAIPITADYEFSGLMAEAIAYSSYCDVRPKAYELVYKQKALRDERSAEILDMVFNNSYIDFNSIYDFGSMNSTVNNAISGSGTLISDLDSKLPSAEQQIENFLETWNSQK